MDPDNIASLNADSDLIAQSSSPKLVGEPLLAERRRLLDPEVCAVNRHFASLALIAPQSKPPANL
jgi:hypothetical protein